MTHIDLLHRTKIAIADAESLGFEGTAKALSEILADLENEKSRFSKSERAGQELAPLTVKA